MVMDYLINRSTTVLLVQEAGNLEDPNWRVPDPTFVDQQYMGGGFTFGVPNAQHLDFSGPGGHALETSKLSNMFCD